MIHVLVVDDHPSVGAGTKSAIEQEEDMKADIITESDEVIEKVNDKQYDVYLIDLFMPKMNGVELTKEILGKNPESIVLIYTGYDIVTHYNYIMDAGVSGFISKTATSEQLITAIRCALREEVVMPLQLLRQLRRVETGASTNEGRQEFSGIVLSKREQQILKHVGEGEKNITIAENLSVSQRTIELDLTKIFSKLDVSSRTEAYKKAWEYGMLSVEDIESTTILE